MLEEPLEGARPVDGVVALVDDILLRLGREGQGELLIGEALLQVGHEQVDDLRDLGFLQRLIEDDLVEPVQKFRAETLFQQETA